MKKPKRKKVWCSEDPKAVDWAVGERHKNKIIDRVGVYQIPSRIKCPDCKKRFRPRVRTCGDYNCWHIYVPPHKKRVIA